MLCPVCSDPLNPTIIPTKGGGRLKLETCQTCGGIWSEHGVANRLTPEQAEGMATHLKSTAGVSALDPVCNRCGVAMSKVNIESVPPDVLVFSCPKCQANWFPTGQLPKLRKAQWLKLEYLKAFNIPFASFSSVLLPVLMTALLGIGALYTARLITQPTKLPLQAEETLQDFQINQTGKDSFKISFQTPEPAKSYLKFVIRGKPGRLTISAEPQRFHEIQVSGITERDLYQVSLEPIKGKPFSTSPQSFFP